ncbi:hypothetical protein DES53_103260 [Roseimicrobium gellanilyticum]|uniref:Leucine rich repeat (LRR) protein n=1 Tax=Roseimicrobium gellanilyticum TaxID=748857 RepID=A0A366HRT4_9BACT|nr:hypothetical protein [Roseimicrobium gellanilyticum]RBP45262.1 hypothetical protein DES53_103260 [Roseimicrobium gellanilyticum]
MAQAIPLRVLLPLWMMLSIPAPAQEASKIHPPEFVSSVPLCFWEPPSGPYIVRRTEFHGAVRMKDPQLTKQVHRSYMTLYDPLAYVIASGTDDSQCMPPLKFVTTPLVDDKPATESMLNYVNASSTSDRPGTRGKITATLFTEFDLVDLFGVEPTPRLHEIINNIDCTGTLVLPFSGVDLKRIKRLPPRIRRLVIYNSEIGKALEDHVRSMPELEELVLWGCRHTDEVFYSGPVHEESRTPPIFNQQLFPDLCSKTKVLFAFHCSESLHHCLGWHSWPQLERLESTRDFFLRRAWDVGAKGGKYVEVGYRKPEYPKLKAFSYYVVERLFNDWGGIENWPHMRQSTCEVMGISPSMMRTYVVKTSGRK